MEEISYFKDNIPKNSMEASCLDEILCYWDLQGELFQCYIDNNWVKCKWLHEYVEFLKRNQDIENNMINNLLKYKQKQWKT